jgi:hypothetical protein
MGRILKRNIVRKKPGKIYYIDTVGNLCVSDVASYKGDKKKAKKKTVKKKPVKKKVIKKKVVKRKPKKKKKR